MPGRIRPGLYADGLSVEGLGDSAIALLAATKHNPLIFLEMT